MKLSPLFSDGMMLQRGQINLLWGYTTANHLVEGSFGECLFSTNAKINGYFEVNLPSLPAGGPYELKIIADKKKTIKDIMVGDVFLLGGQSNMEMPISRTIELYREEIENTCEPNIRMFEVPKEYEFQEEREEITNGRWIKACGEELLDFSAAGFFAAQEIKKEHKVPIGLIQTAVGGTPAKAWASEETIKEMGLYIDELEECKVPGYPKKIEESEAKREQDWLKRAKEAFSKKGLKKGTINIPGIWKNNELHDFCGAIRLRKEFNLSAMNAKRETELVLGAIIDADTVYINGSYIGETGYKYPPRYYTIPAGVLKKGKNILEIQMNIFRSNGGFMPGKQYGLRFLKERELFLDLAGDWTWELMEEMEYLPDSTFFSYKAAGLYKGMLSPISKWNVCGVLYYQGESNTGNAETYNEEMKALINDWRKLWKQEQLPFIYVQLAGYADGDLVNQGTAWARLRYEQEKTLEVSNTAMVVAYDIGEYNDLHPMNKKTLGQRLALAVRSLIYKEDIISMGPKVESISVKDDGKVRVSFSNVGRGLCAGYSCLNKEIYDVEILDAYGNYKTAKASIDVKQAELVACLKNVKEPKGIRYAWKDCPEKGNLYNSEGLPALPFRKEWI